MADTDEVLAADETFFAALNAIFQGDIAPMEKLWSHQSDVIYMGPQPDLFEIGWKVTDADWIKQAAMKLSGSIEVVDRHMTISGDMAVVHHRARSSNLDQSGAPVTFTMRGTNVFRREGGTWKMIAHHSDPLPFSLGL
ncbi:YybH family protein [Bauldia sp.]|uniref:YybH family protein n=1 Tax=Bauldia sp. TaxID=2575872 RepID=UPI003BAC42A5